MAGIDFSAEAAALRDVLIARRRDLHQHPELAYQEVRTAGIVADELRALGFEVQTGIGQTGVVGILEGAKDGPTVLYRADMDALPILEENDTVYVSHTPGVMHACGHDGHVTVALGVAQLLAAQREYMAGRVKFVFQPAEEIGGGALAMVADGVLRDPVPDVVLGMHLWNPLPLGVIGVADGPVMAGGARFKIDLQGVGGHGALPHATVDPVTCAAQLVLALNQITSRRINQLTEPTVLSVTGIETSSQAFNVIPDKVTLQGTYRMLGLNSQQLRQYIHDVTGGICGAAGCSFGIEIEDITLTVMNDPDVTARVRSAITGLRGVKTLDTTARTMASEDVSYMMQDIPAMYIFVGSSNAEKGLTYGHHHPRFDFDEDVLPLAVAVMSAAVADYVMDYGQ